MRPLSFLLFASSCVLVSSALVAEEVRASSFGWDAADATAALQGAIDSGAARVVVDRQADDWFIRPVVLRRSNQEIVIEDGVAVRAKKGEFKGIGDRLVTIPAGVSNVVLRGEGEAMLAMEKRERTEKTEVWTLEFPVIEEDVEFRIGTPGLPIVATTPEAILSGG